MVIAPFGVVNVVGADSGAVRGTTGDVALAAVVDIDAATESPVAL